MFDRSFCKFLETCLEFKKFSSSISSIVPDSYFLLSSSYITRIFNPSLLVAPCLVGSFLHFRICEILHLMTWRAMEPGYHFQTSPGTMVRFALCWGSSVRIGKSMHTDSVIIFLIVVYMVPGTTILTSSVPSPIVMCIFIQQLDDPRALGSAIYFTL